MASEIVENDDVAFAQGWQEKVLHISAEAFAVDRTVEDAGCCELVMAECAEECPCGAKPCRRAPLGPQPRNGATLVLIQVSSRRRADPDQARPARIANAGATRDVGASLFEGEQCFS